MLQLFGKQREDGLAQGLLPCPKSRLLHLPPGQKLIKSSCDISKRPVACFHSLCFPSLRVRLSFFHPKSARAGSCVGQRLLEAPRVTTAQGQRARTNFQPTSP